jgi:hypothetical protein
LTFGATRMAELSALRAGRTYPHWNFWVLIFVRSWGVNIYCPKQSFTFKLCFF